MTRSALSEFSNLLLSIYRAAQEEPVDRFQDVLLDLVKPLLPFDVSMWGTCAMTPAGIDIHSIHLHNFAPGMLEAYEKVKHQDTAAARVTREAATTIGFDAQREFSGPDQAEIRDFAREFGQRHCFITSHFHQMPSFGRWISLFRADENQPGTPE